MPIKWMDKLKELNTHMYRPSRRLLRSSSVFLCRIYLPAAATNNKCAAQTLPRYTTSPQICCACQRCNIRDYLISIKSHIYTATNLVQPYVVKHCRMYSTLPHTSIQTQHTGEARWHMNGTNKGPNRGEALISRSNVWIHTCLWN